MVYPTYKMMIVTLHIMMNFIILNFFSQFNQRISEGSGDRANFREESLNLIFCEGEKAF